MSANDCYASDFGAQLWIYENKRDAKRRPSAVKEYNKHPTRWVQTKNPVTIRMEYRRDEDSRGILSVTRDGIETCRVATNHYRGGRVGFSWQDVKFVITRISIAGTVDPEWAAAALAATRGEKLRSEFRLFAATDAKRLDPSAVPAHW